MTTTHPEFNEKTTALTVAAAFPERIRNKTGQPSPTSMPTSDSNIIPFGLT